MDVSIVASIGSFILSERVIKAKAVVLIAILCTVTYDLFIHSNDPVSLRVYRGPACIAISLIACAFCLRTWRRNGIACDELLFLPGTRYAETARDLDSNVLYTLPLNLRLSTPTKISSPKKLQESSTLSSRPSRSPLRKLSEGSSTDSDEFEELRNSSFDINASISDEENEFEKEMMPLNIDQENKIESRRRWYNCNGWEKCRTTRRRNSPVPKPLRNSDDVDNVEKGKSPTAKKMTDQLKGILKFFSSSQESNEYAPSGPIVASAGIDLCMPVLTNFHLFMLASKATTNDEDDDEAAEYSIPPQVLPLIFLTILSFRAVIPFKARTRFWTTAHSVISAPFYNVTFRDAFLGDIATSMVRPLQDICFAIFYYFASMYGIFTGKVDLEDTGSRLTNNILLHNVVLPTCAVLPLLCRFLQTLRQAYTEQRRWPHLGNAFKYLTASLVISYGMTHSENERSNLWTLSFVLCTLYQIWWDVVMDWELITIIPKEASGGIYIPFFGRIQLRSKRLLKSKKTYWRVIILNALFRFIWMLSFIPAYHLNTSTREMKDTFSRDNKAVVGFVVSLIELMRRSAWGILRLELETIKLTDEDYISGTSYSMSSSRIQYSWFAPNERAVTSPDDQSPPPLTHIVEMKRAAYRLLVKKLFILELAIWAGMYVGFGFLVSACL